MASEKGRYLQKYAAKEPIGQYQEEKTALFEELRTQDNGELMHIIEASYEVMTAQQRRTVYGEILDSLRVNVYPGKALLEEIEKFREDSLNGRYYAPFDINSKNFTHVPPETEEWFDRLADFFTAAILLVEQGEYQNAVDAFDLVYELVDLMESGDEIIFADEYGSWMIPIRENDCVAAYLKAIAQVENGVGFANAAVDLLKRDKNQGFSLKVYSAALNAGCPEQIAFFMAKVEKLALPIKLSR